MYGRVYSCHHHPYYTIGHNRHCRVKKLLFVYYSDLKRYVHPEPVNLIYFGRMFFVDVIKLKNLEVTSSCVKLNDKIE